MFLSNDTVQPGDIFVPYAGANDVLFEYNITGTMSGENVRGQVTRLDSSVLVGKQTPSLTIVVFRARMADVCLLGATKIVLMSYPDLSVLPFDLTLDNATQANLTN